VLFIKRKGEKEYKLLCSSLENLSTAAENISSGAKNTALPQK